MQASVRERVAARTAPHTHLFAAESRELYAATRSAVDAMGYRFLRGGPAQGEIDGGVSNIGAQAAKGFRDRGTRLFQADRFPLCDGMGGDHTQDTDGPLIHTRASRQPRSAGAAGLQAGRDSRRAPST